MWSFFVELTDILEDKNELDLPALLFTLGNVPNQAPEKEFKSEPLDDNSTIIDAESDFDEFDFDNFDELMS